MKDSVLIYTENKDIIDELTDAQAGEVFKAIMLYQVCDGVYEFTDPVSKIAFLGIKKQIDRCNESYEETKRKRSEAGKKGMEKRWSVNNKDVSKNNNRITNDNTVITENNKNNLNDNDNVKDKDKYKEPYIPEQDHRGFHSCEDVNGKYMEYLKARRENKKPLKSETSIKANAEKLIRMATVNGAFDTDRAIAILDQSIANGWQGLFEPKEEPKERSGMYGGFNLDDLEARLGGWT